MSEEDQKFYVPASPVNGGPYAIWNEGSQSSTAAPPSSTVAAANAQTAWSRIAEEDLVNTIPEHSVAPTPSTPHYSSNAAQRQQLPPAEPKRSSFVVVRGGRGDAALTERRARERGASAPGTDTPLYPAPIGSTHSTSPQQGLSTSPGQSPDDQPLRHNSLKPFLEQERAHLGGAEMEEDWEKGLLAARRGGAEGPAVDAGAHASDDSRQSSLETPPPSGTFPSQLSSPHRGSGSTSPRQMQPQRGHTTDPWLSSSAAAAPSSLAVAPDEPLRRHQSLKTFRAPRHREPSIEQTLSSSPASAGGWPEHINAAVDPTGAGPDQYGTTALLGGTPPVSGFGSRTRSGTSPAPLALQHSNSLGHSSATAFADSLGPVRLSHSNSLSAAYPSSSGTGTGSTTLHHSNSLGSRSDSGTSAAEARTRVLSPVVSAFGGAKSPWSLTEEESQQLGLNSSFGSSESAGVSRDSSGSSHHHRAGPAPTTQPLVHPDAAAQTAHAAEIRRLEDALRAIQMGGFPTPPPVGQQFERNTPSPGRRLTPLMTSSEALNSHSGLVGGLGRHGPASAAAFVPPIGHSHPQFAPHALDGISEYSTETASSSPPIPQQQQFQPAGSFAPNLAAPGGHAGGDLYSSPNARGPVTAMPGNVNANDWSRHKEALFGNNASSLSSGPGANLGFAPHGLPSQATADPQMSAVHQLQMQQQQQQINSLQNQMAEALTAMDAMRAQGAVLPANFDLATAARLSGAVGQAQQQQQQVPETPVDVGALAQTKGYNPSVFDLNPVNARFFVIKSYTEEDVHKVRLVSLVSNAHAEG